MHLPLGVDGDEDIKGLGRVTGRVLADYVATGRLSVSPKEETAISLFETFLREEASDPNALIGMHRPVFVLVEARRRNEALAVMEQLGRAYSGHEDLIWNIRHMLDQRSGN